MTPEVIIGSNLVQYGFAGFAFLLTGIIFYTIKEWRKEASVDRGSLQCLTQKTHDVIVKNTAAFVSHRESLNGLKEATKENTEVLRSINGRR